MTRLEAVAEWHERNPSAEDAVLTLPNEQLQAYAAALAFARNRGGKRLKALLQKCEVS